MGRKTKKIKKPKKVELSKTERFVKRATNKLFKFLAIHPFSFVLLNIAFYFNVSISVELYFIIIYSTAISLALFIGLGMFNNLLIYKAWNNQKIKSSLLIWLGRSIFLVILIIDIKMFIFPMTLDVTRLVTGHYKEIYGTVKFIETRDDRVDSGSSKGKWYEKIKYVYFIEQTSKETIKIAFHANSGKENIKS